MDEGLHGVETHPLEPFLPEGGKLLILGSFPPSRKRWGMDFYYPNFQNDMWRIMGLAFFGDKSHFVDGKRFDEARIRCFCAGKGIALSDTARKVKRLNGDASDKFLEVIEPFDPEALLAPLPECRAIAVTGQKALETLLSVMQAPEPAVGTFSEFTWRGRAMRLYRMPSSSRAYPMPLERKAAVYAGMFAGVGL